MADLTAPPPTQPAHLPPQVADPNMDMHAGTYAHQGVLPAQPNTMSMPIAAGVYPQGYGHQGAPAAMPMGYGAGQAPMAQAPMPHPMQAQQPAQQTGQWNHPSSRGNAGYGGGRGGGRRGGTRGSYDAGRGNYYGGSVVQQQAAPLELPSGWQVAHTSNGHTYYIDHNTHTTQWEPPYAQMGVANNPYYANSNAQRQQRGVIDPGKRKTKMCHNIEGGMTCRFGEGCAFAHSQDELQRGRDVTAQQATSAQPVPTQSSPQVYQGTS